MTKNEIHAAIKERLEKRWARRCKEELAAPVCVVAIKQLPGDDFGTPVLCTTEDMPNDKLAVLLAGAAKLLLEDK